MRKIFQNPSFRISGVIENPQNNITDSREGLSDEPFLERTAPITSTSENTTLRKTILRFNCDEQNINFLSILHANVQCLRNKITNFSKKKMTTVSGSFMRKRVW